DRTRIRTVVTGKEIGDAHLKRPFKEAVKTPLTRRIIEFADLEFKMPTNIKLYNGTTDSEDHLSRFSFAANSRERPMPAAVHDQILNEESMLQRSNGINQDNKEGQRDPRSLRGKVDNRNRLYHGRLGGHEDIIVHGRSQMPELAKRYSDKVPKTMDGMMTRLDDFVRSEEVFASTELQKGEASQTSGRPVVPISRREDQFHRGGYGSDIRRNKGRNTFNPRDGLTPYRVQTPYQAPRDQGFHRSKFWLAHQITKGNIGFRTAFKLAATKADATLTQEGKLRQMGRGNMKGRDAGRDKVINMIRSWPNDRKRKSAERDESWMKAAIMFLPLLMEDSSDGPLFIEAVMEGYLVRRVYVDQGASVEVMFKHCFENISPAIKSRLREIQMDFIGFTGGVVKPLGKIELEVVFEDGGMFRMVMINFTVVRAPSPYNIIFGRTCLKSHRAVSSTIHSMVKFPTPRGSQVRQEANGRA
nr:reverse transcriptase domain-containing protein [Tanacetum cinerariifolium]